MQLSYKTKERTMNLMLHGHESPKGFRSTYKAVPIAKYEMVKWFIDFTKYYVMFRGPRRGRGYSTRKADAHSFDVYQRDARTVERIRIEREAFQRGVAYGQAYDRMITRI